MTSLKNSSQANYLATATENSRKYEVDDYIKTKKTHFTLPLENSHSEDEQVGSPDSESDIIAVLETPDELDEVVPNKKGEGAFPFSTVFEEREFSEIMSNVYLDNCSISLRIIDWQILPSTLTFFNQSLFTIQLEHGSTVWVISRKARQIQNLHNELRVFKTMLKLPGVTSEGRDKRQSILRQFKDERGKNDVSSSRLVRFPRKSLQRMDNFTISQVELYLKNLLKHSVLRNHHDVLEFLEISPLSFVIDLGAKLQEGFVRKRSGGKKFLLCCGTVTDPFVIGRYNRRWLVIRESCLFCINPDSGIIRTVMLIDSAFQVSHGFRHTRVTKGLLVTNLSRSLILKCDGEASEVEWSAAIENIRNERGTDFAKQNRLFSFAPPRKGSRARWYVDGSWYMSDVADLLESAREEIFITDWWLSPDIYLKRPDLTGRQWKLNEILKRQADRGVKVFILLYKEVELALGLNSLYSKQNLCQMSSNIKVLRHPDHLKGGSLYWAHHEKMVIVDQMWAFIGGIDLCYGRWDDHRHKLVDVGHAGIKAQVQDSALSRLIVNASDIISSVNLREGRSSESGDDSKTTLADVSQLKSDNQISQVEKRRDCDEVDRKQHDNHILVNDECKKEKMIVHITNENDFDSKLNTVSDIKLMSFKHIGSDVELDEPRKTELSATGNFLKKEGKSENICDITPECNLASSPSSDYVSAVSTSSQLNGYDNKFEYKDRTLIEKVDKESSATETVSTIQENMSNPTIVISSTESPTHSQSDDSTAKIFDENSSFSRSSDEFDYLDPSTATKAIDEGKRKKRRFGKKKKINKKSTDPTSLQEKVTKNLKSVKSRGIDLVEDLKEKKRDIMMLRNRKLKRSASVNSELFLASDSDESEDASTGMSKIKSKMRKKLGRRERIVKSPNSARGSLIELHKELSTQGESGSVHLWIGKDYVNWITKDLYDPQMPFNDSVNRNETPRMPWHDIAMYVEGPAARDAARHFIQRWNAVKSEKMKNNERYPYLLPRTYNPSSFVPSQLPIKHKVKSQVVRSVGLWSSGLSATERSIYNAYLDAIKNSKHYIYIENQFFISSSSHGSLEVMNLVAYHIYERIFRAYRNNETFRVFVVLPLLPAFEGQIGTPSGIAMQYILHYTYQSIVNGRNSLLGLLKQSKIDWQRYISFTSLRTYDWLQGKLVSEIIYIHSKLMIVDDRYVIAGSANINDRSLLGMRDSEVCVVLEDEEFTKGKMNGRSYKRGKFAGSLRMYLFSEHLGVKEGSSIDVTDPISDKFFVETWNAIATRNSAIFEDVFKCVPSDNVKSFSELSQVRSEIPLSRRRPEKARMQLNNIQGRLVLYPLEFLKNEELKPKPTSKEFLLPTEMWV